jgi:hypothetical protein
MSEIWYIVDSRNGRRATIACFISEVEALKQIAEWNDRDRRGLRPDCHDLLPHLRAVKENYKGSCSW